MTGWNDADRLRGFPRLALQLARGMYRHHACSSDCAVPADRSEPVGTWLDHDVLKVFASRECA